MLQSRKELVLISTGAFTFAKNVTSIEIPSAVTEIDDLTFHLQRTLKKVSIPDSVEEIGSDAFWCSNDITIYAAGSYADTYAKENDISFAAK